jgi:hypothetical protein
LKSAKPIEPTVKSTNETRSVFRVPAKARQYLARFAIVEKRPERRV